MVITLGINIGASKTIYLIFLKINEKYISNVLLLNNSFRTIPSVICYTKNHRLFGNNAFSSVKQYFESSYNNIPRSINFEDNQKKREDELKERIKKKSKELLLKSKLPPRLEQHKKEKEEKQLKEEKIKKQKLKEEKIKKQKLKEEKSENDNKKIINYQIMKNYKKISKKKSKIKKIKLLKQ